MVEIIFFLIAVIGTFVVAMVLNIRGLRDRCRQLVETAQPVARIVVGRALGQLNCKVKWDKQKDGDTAHYTYQGGHFNLTITKGNPYVRLSYLFFFEADIADLELVRTVCNLCNLNTDAARVVYTLDNKKAKADLHIIAGMYFARNDVRDELERAMGDAFRWQSAFVAKYNDMQKNVGKGEGVDVEKANAQYARDLQLIHEQEMTHQEAGPDWHETADNRMELRGLLSVAMGLADIVPIKLTIAIGERLEVVDDPDAILAYAVSTPLIDDGAFSHASATGRLDFYDPRDPVTPRHLTIDFEREESTKDTLFYRVTMSLAPVSLGKNVGDDSVQHLKQMSSVLLGHELTPAKDRLAHFRYVWKEAMGKTQNGDTKELTDEEKVLADMQDPHFAYNFYRGRDLYLRKRFYEALLPLENAFRSMTKLYDMHDRHAVELLDQIAYFIGCCYMNLHQYDRACYYLQITLPTSHQTYSEAYINCLVNGGDYRAMDVLNGLLGSLQMMMERMGNDDGDDDDQQPMPEKAQLQSFINFVKRRKAYLLVNLGRYDEAERMLKKLLDDPDNSDFALNELAYIQKKK